MRKYYSYGRSRTDFHNLAGWLDKREPFKNSTGSLSGTTKVLAGWASMGHLPDEWSRTFQARSFLIDYVIYSYGTPIAWHDKEAGWVEPDVKYSPTTSQHQGSVRTAISVL